MARPAQNWENEEQLVRAAWYYYMGDLTQDEVAQRLMISRASVGRLLEKSRRNGIVSFTIHSGFLSGFQIANQLKEAYGLSDALVIPGAGEDSEEQGFTNRRLARGGVQYLQNHLSPGSTLAMGWGETVGATFELLPSDLLDSINTVTLTGGVDAYIRNLQRFRDTNGPETRDFVIPTPIVVSSESLAEALRAEDRVREAVERSKNADHALIGIGGVTGTPTLIQLGYAGGSELREYAAAGAVGDILGLFFDKHGRILDLPIHRRRIGIGVGDLKAIPSVIGVAGGLGKFDAIRGALAGEYIDILITTEETARALLNDTDSDISGVASSEE